MDTIQGACFCGAVTFSADPVPILKAYCHCSNCQRLSGCPFIHTIHVSDSDFTWTTSDATSALDTYVIPDKTWKTRYRCKKCGVCVASYNSQKNKWSLWGPTFSRDEEGRIDSKVWEIVKPDAHIFYGTRMLDVDDDLGKWEGYKDESTRLG
ncbi:hypothetical protein K439DRAFT_1406370 [Ramaria rubella]|nr:hypothetical protein K439DRAFT_1406370 [Ramaria rubella]